MFTFVLLLFPLIFYCTGDGNDEKYKSATIEKIVKKVCNITMDYVVNASLEEKPNILKMIEEKLNKSAISLGAEGHKYVKLLMHGVKLIAYNNTKFANSDTLPEHNTESTSILRSLNETDISQDNSKTGKDQIIIDIANKIESLAKVYLKAAKTPAKRKQAIETIKKKVLDSANKKHILIHNKHNEIKHYSDLIAQGLDLMMERSMRNEARRMEIEFHVNKDVDLTSKFNDQASSISNKVDDEGDCTIITEKTCSQLTTLGSFTCLRVDKSLPLEKLCNDVSDCPDQSDEKYCITQGIERIHKTISLMSQIHSPPIYKCFVVQLGSSVLTRQNTDLRNVLDTQLKFIQKYSNISILSNPTSPKDKINKYVVKKSVNEIAVVVTTLAAALEGALCSRRRSIGMFDQLGEITTADDILDTNEHKEYWSPKSCECTGMVCANVSCQDPCPKVCMQKNSLNQWICESTDGNPGVPVSVLCDGKIDCYDKSDETNCSYGAMHAKFLASGYFYEILNLVKQKAVSQEYLPIQYKLLALHGSVIYLQKLSISKNVDNDLLKEARDRCLSTLTSIYEYLLFKSESEGHLDHFYKFLNALKDKLLRSLKLANTGNEKLGTTDECFCIAGRCGTTNCSKICVKACPVHPKMTRHYCGNTKSNTTVPIELVCDGKLDCPKGEDELDCKQEMCRKHHLLLVRQSFENAGLNMKGTAAGEALLVWKSKATLLVKLAEREQLTPQLLRKIVEDILQQLVTTYGSIDDFRRSDSKSRQLLKQFIEISRKIINTVKICGNIH
ncbi:hypothetical protein K1T71_006812 [Dendrolimus kikuchii]|uniref:Uncharacterized protein n=1 Tax=Dendrolimus kikuchii TaxID=765133 RepID=A0ACC1D2I2_9NEOP|nr:hypothetical protein K1T71_006812 [Dendrolimus kikuchii]